MKISICGKGGSGKSVVTTLLAGALSRRGFRVLVIDSDESNSGLYRLLGLEKPPAPLLEELGGRKQVFRVLAKDPANRLESDPSIMTREHIAFEDIPREHVATRDSLSLVNIGKILHSMEGCACPMGVLSREFLNRLRLEEDEVALVDTEAGVEHFGRGVDSSMDTVLVVVEPSYESLRLAEKVRAMAEGLGVRRMYAVLNKVASSEMASRLTDELGQRNIEAIGSVSHDPEVFDACLEGRPLEPGIAARDSEAIVDAILAGKGPLDEGGA
jgi:CO dehydrogenase maturation factor